MTLVYERRMLNIPILHIDTNLINARQNLQYKVITFRVAQILWMYILATQSTRYYFHQNQDTHLTTRMYRSHNTIAYSLVSQSCQSAPQVFPLHCNGLEFGCQARRQSTEISMQAINSSCSDVDDLFLAIAVAVFLSIFHHFISE